MKFDLFAVGCLFVVLAAGCADKKPRRPGGGGGGPPAGISNGANGKGPAASMKIANDLGLNEEQKKKFMKTMREHGEKMKAMQAKGTVSPKDKRAMHESLAKDMKGILTPEQFANWQQMRQAMRAGSQTGSGQPTGPGGPPMGPQSNPPPLSEPPPSTFQ